MIRAVIVDDEKEGLDILEYDLRQLGLDIDIAGKFHDPQEALKFLANNPTDVLLLDIEMPWMSGFDLLDRLENISFKVIFVTAYDQYAIKAFRYYAIDYLLKPVTRDQLREAINRVIESPAGEPDARHIRALIESISLKPGIFTKFVIPTLEGYNLVDIADIVRCQADNNYVEVYMIDGRRVVMSKPLKYAQEILEGNGFFRAHQSHLINLQHVMKYVKTDRGHVVMRDKSIVYLSRGKKEGFVKMLKERL